MRVAIIGSGAVGSVIGGCLAREGVDTTLIGRKVFVDSVGRQGLAVTTRRETFQVRVDVSEKLDFTPDIVFLTVKTQDLQTACEAIRPFLRETLVVVMQNGVHAEDIAAGILGKENVIGCIVLFNAAVRDAGAVELTTDAGLVIGNPFNPGDERIQHLETLFNSLFPVMVAPRFRDARWTKLLINLYANSLEAMTGFPFSECIRNRIIRDIGIRIIKEALSVITRAGVRIIALPDFSPVFFRAVLLFPIPIVSAIFRFRFGTQKYARVTTSTLQSLQKGKVSEIDYLNGEIVRLGKTCGHPTPYNEKVLALVHQTEKSTSFLSVREIQTAFLNI